MKAIRPETCSLPGPTEAVSPPFPRLPDCLWEVNSSGDVGRKNRGRQLIVSRLPIRQVGVRGGTQRGRNSPEGPPSGCRCAPRQWAEAHIWARAQPPLSRGPPRLVSAAPPSALPLEKSLAATARQLAADPADHRRPEKAIMRDLAAGKFGGFQKGKSYWRSAAAAAHRCTTARCFQHMDLVPRVKKKKDTVAVNHVQRWTSWTSKGFEFIHLHQTV